MLVQAGKKVFIVFTEDGFTFGNCLLVDDDIRLMIDSGAGKILEKTDPAHVDILLNTHHHYDHIRGNKSFENAQVLMHPIGHPCMASVEKVMALDNWDELMEQSIDEITAADDQDPNEQWRVDGPIVDGQIIDCGHTKLQVLHTPGHSQGHCSFLFLDEDLAFLGDICLTKVGPWYGEPGTNLTDFINSIDRIIDIQPGRVATCHVNRIISDPIPVLTEYRDRILKREERISKHIKATPSTIDELADRHLIYRLHPSPYVLFWEKAMLKNHLQRLIQMGLVVESDNGVFGWH